MQEVEFILYVKEQAKSKCFYEKLLQIAPVLDVPGMTEFKLSASVKLGIMPESSITKIIGDKLPHPGRGNDIPRCELYLKVPEANEYINRGINLGATLISPLQNRDWGDKVGYMADLDEHIIAFAEKK